MEQLRGLKQEVCPRVHCQCFRSRHFHHPVLHHTRQRKGQNDSLRHRTVSVFANTVNSDHSQLYQSGEDNSTTQRNGFGDDPKADQSDKLRHRRTRDKTQLIYFRILQKIANSPT